MTNEEKEALGTVKARFLNRNMNELEYLLNQMAGDRGLGIDSKKERGLINSQDSDKFQKIVQQEL